MLTNRCALVTGVSSGIGKATALRLGTDGAAVAVNYHSDEEQDDADSVVAQIRDGGGTALAVQAEVGSENDVQRLITTTVDRLGGLDVLVNNAGIEKLVPLLQMSLTEWDVVLRTNLTGAFLCLREAGKVMAEGNGGVIVNMFSVHEHIPWPGVRALLRKQRRHEAAHADRRARAGRARDGRCQPRARRDHHADQPVDARRAGGLRGRSGRNPAWPDGLCGGDRRQRRLARQ